jgi:hypothetical protein
MTAAWRDYDERRPAPPNPQASDPPTQDRLYDLTSRILRDLLPS